MRRFLPLFLFAIVACGSDDDGDATAATANGAGGQPGVGGGAAGAAGASSATGGKASGGAGGQAVVGGGAGQGGGSGGAVGQGGDGQGGSAGEGGQAAGGVGGMGGVAGMAGVSGMAGVAGMAGMSGMGGGAGAGGVVVALTAPIVYVSRAPQPSGSFYWDAPLDMPGVGPRSRTRPSPGGRLMRLDPGGSSKVLVDGANPTAASLQLIDVNGPAVSHDGKTIAFSGLPQGDHDTAPSSSPGAWRLYLIDADGGNLRAVPTPDEVRDDDFQRRLGPAAQGLMTYDDFDPAFLPDDQHLVFASTRYPAHALYSGVRASNLFVVGLDGGGLYRVTSERNGADRPLVDPVTGQIVYARWWRNFRYPTDDLAEVAPSGSGDDTGIPNVYWKNDQTGIDYQATERLFVQRGGVTADRYGGAVAGDDTMFRNAWQIAAIDPDGNHLQQLSSYYRSEPASHAYGGAFTDSGVYFASFFPMLNMTEASGFGGIRRHERGAHPFTPIIGVTDIQIDGYVEPHAKGDAPSYGIYQAIYAGEPEVLPDASGAREGAIVFSMTAKQGDITQDYGLYLMAPDGAQVTPLVDEPGRAELRARAIAPRKAPPLLPLLAEGARPSHRPPRATEHTSSEEYALPASQMMSGGPGTITENGTFLFTALNVYANAGVDEPIVSAIPVGEAYMLHAFTDYQRHNPGSFAVIDWPIELAAVPISADGFVEVKAPAHVSLFEQVRDKDGKVAPTDGRYQTHTGAVAHVAGMNFGTAGTRQLCLGCHAGHSMMKVPPIGDIDVLRAWASYSNLAPGAEVIVSSDNADGLSRKQALTDRVVERLDNLYESWRSDNDVQAGVSIKLRFMVPVRVRSVKLYNQRQTPDCDVVVQKATVRLYADDAATTLVPGAWQAGPLATTGTEVNIDADGLVARVVEVTLDEVTGKLFGYSVSTLGEIEVIARGE